eukprot:scaffold53149_cov22-Tisochrysis_lutea.AAC.1
MHRSVVACGTHNLSGARKALWLASDGSLEHSPLDADVVQAVQALAGTELSHLGPSKVAALLRFLVDEMLETDFVRE